MTEQQIQDIAKEMGVDATVNDCGGNVWELQFDNNGKDRRVAFRVDGARYKFSRQIVEQAYRAVTRDLG